MARDGRCERGAKRIEMLLNAADPQVVRDDALKRRVGLEAVGEAFAIGTLKAQTDPGEPIDGIDNDRNGIVDD